MVGEPTVPVSLPKKAATPKKAAAARARPSAKRSTESPSRARPTAECVGRASGDQIRAQQLGDHSYVADNNDGPAAVVAFYEAGGAKARWPPSPAMTVDHDDAALSFLQECLTRAPILASILDDEVDSGRPLEMSVERVPEQLSLVGVRINSGRGTRLHWAKHAHAKSLQAEAAEAQDRLAGPKRFAQNDIRSSIIALSEKLSVFGITSNSWLAREFDAVAIG
jgi:hypothetical protein